jgi:hypothetical protein
VAVVGISQQGREAGAGVEPGRAEPIDAAVAGDQRRCPQVADHRVVLDPHLIHPTTRVRRGVVGAVQALRRGLRPTASSSIS